MGMQFILTALFVIFTRLMYVDPSSATDSQVQENGSIYKPKMVDDKNGYTDESDPIFKREASTNKGKFDNNYCDNRDILKLQERDMFHHIFPEQCYNEIQNAFLESPQCVYAGFDPTADSLHIGNLLILKNLLHWQRSGHKVIALIGGATALIGDPSGRVKDREQQSPVEIRKRSYNIQKNMEQIFQNHETFFWNKMKNASLLKPVIFLNNMDWYREVNVIEFLDKVGRHFRIGKMFQKESVQKRIESDSGMSFLEFSYQIFQAYDWYHLYKEYACKFQVGGKDQMGNMEAGHRLIRQLLDKPSYAFTLPLITDDNGDKFGKSVPNAVWLDPTLTSPFQFYQFFLRLRDSEACKIIKFFSFRPMPEIQEILLQQEQTPEKRIAQTSLAEEITLLVHGEKGLEAAKTTTSALYTENIQFIGELHQNEVERVLQGCTVAKCIFRPDLSLLDFTLDIRCFSCKSDALRIIKAGGLYINYKRAQNPREIISQSVHILPNNLTLLRVGKRNIYVVKWMFKSE